MNELKFLRDKLCSELDKLGYVVDEKIIELSIEYILMVKGLGFNDYSVNDYIDETLRNYPEHFTKQDVS